MTDRIKNILIGFFVTGALAIMVALVLFLKPTVGDGKKILHVRFTNVAGISVGTRVTFAGKPIGEVIHIKEMPKARDEADEQGRIYLYQLTLKLDSGVDVYNCDEVAIRTTGLMGEKSIAILPRLPFQGEVAYLITNQVIFANSTDPLENTFNQVSKVAKRAEMSISRFDDWFNQNQMHVSSLLKSFDGAMGQIGAVLELIDTEQLIPSLSGSVALINENMELIRSGLDEGRLLPKLASLTDNLDQTVSAFNTDGMSMLRNWNQISSDIASGSGTIGRLLNGDDLYLRVASLMNKGETLMNDINHYGILFQYSKQWQRTRAKRATALRALETPQEFRAYFETEVDSMTTSLGRLSELMEKAGTEDRAQIAQSAAFKRTFADLMRQSQGLSDSLRLYNEGLIAESEGVQPN